MDSSSDIDDYISKFPPDIRITLDKIRHVIRAAAPEAEEAISYQMPTFKWQGKNIVHFAAWKTHIGFYPTPSGTAKFKKQLTRYKHAKGSVQFPLNTPIPYGLIKRIVEFRIGEYLHK